MSTKKKYSAFPEFHLTATWTLKHGNIYISFYKSISKLKEGIKNYINIYNLERFLSALNCKKPMMKRSRISQQSVGNFRLGETKKRLKLLPNEDFSILKRSKNFTNITIKPAGTLPPIYTTGINKLLFFNILALLLRPFMKGIKDGWCILSLARKAL
jgi:hypothetical protein